MNEAHTILIETGGQTIKFTPPEPMDLLSIYRSFTGRHSRSIVTSDGKGTARVAMVPDLDAVVEEIGEFVL